MSHAILQASELQLLMREALLFSSSLCAAERKEGLLHVPLKQNDTGLGHWSSLPSHWLPACKLQVAQQLAACYRLPVKTSVSQQTHLRNFGEHQYQGNIWVNQCWLHVQCNPSVSALLFVNLAGLCGLMYTGHSIKFTLVENKSHISTDYDYQLGCFLK